MERKGFNFSLTTVVIMMIGLTTVAVLLMMLTQGPSLESFGWDQINISAEVL
jgi:hypothetical protein